MSETETVERLEWRVAGDPGLGYPPYRFVFHSEAEALGFLRLNVTFWRVVARWPTPRSQDDHRDAVEACHPARLARPERRPAMTPEEIAALRALAEAATPGPWYWRNTGDAYLFGTRSKVVMAFRRMGMNSAQPVFRDHTTNLLIDAGKANINALPDAAFIAAARTAVPALLDALEVAERENVELRERIKTKADEWDETCRRERSNPTIAHVLRNLLDGPQ